jgi:hypothetical protein
LKLTNLKPRVATLGGSLPTLAASSTPEGAWRTGNLGANERGYTYRWQKASKGFLAKHPLCECPDCQAGKKRVIPATVVNHRIPHRGDMTLFWDRSNWECMSKTCHDKRTQDELKPGFIPPPPRTDLVRGDQGGEGQGSKAEFF